MSITVSAPVLSRLAGIAAGLKAATGRAASYDDAILHLLDGAGDDDDR